MANHEMNAHSDISFSALNQMEGETTQEWVYRALRFMILSGQVTPGRALTIRGLAADLGTSAMPVREALRRLTSEGALESKSNRRIVVPKLTPSRLAELLELRISLEVHAAERALPYINEETVEALVGIDNELNAGLSKGNATNIIINNQAFHRTIYTANKDQVIMPLIERVWLQMGPLHRLALTWLTDNYIEDRHVDILKSLTERDPYGLKNAIEADIREAAGYLTQPALLKEYFEKGGDNPAPIRDYTKNVNMKKLRIPKAT